MKSNCKSKKTLLFAFLYMAILVILDQLTKYLAILELKAKDNFVLIDGVFELHYLENTSAAFGFDLVSFFQNVFHFTYFTQHPQAMLSFKMILFVILTLVVSLFLFLFYLRVPENKRFQPLNIVLLSFIAGAIGNCIDRAWHQYVVDFFYFKLIDFPIFNVADIYVTLAAFALLYLGLIYYKDADYEILFPKKESKNKKEKA